MPGSDFPLDRPARLHATAVCLGARGLLITGAPGSGKSALALALMALGARLVADDQVDISLRDGLPWMEAPDAIRGRIEARFVGILSADPAPGAWVSLVVDLDRNETERLPPARNVEVLGVALPLVHRVESAHFAPAVLQFLKGGRSA